MRPQPISTRDHPDPISLEIIFIRQDRSGTLWIGSSREGLVCYSPATREFTWFRHIPGDSSSLGGQHVSDIYEDHNGMLWFATGGGLSRFDREDKTFRTFTDANGLPGNDVNWVTEDRQGYLWVGTSRGIARFDPAKGLARIYRTTQVIAIGYLALCHLHGHDSTMYISGNYGFNVFHPQRAWIEDRIPPVYIVSFKIFDREIETVQSITVLSDITMLHSDNYFSFEFSALGLYDPQRNRYAYMLQGFDRNWIDAGYRRYAAYTNVPPGEYVLRVKGSTSEGVWNEQGAQLRIVITPPIWKTWWAYAVYLLVTVSRRIVLCVPGTPEQNPSPASVSHGTS